MPSPRNVEVRVLARGIGAVLTGVDASLVDVECDLGNGLPAFTVVGLPDASVQEARDRVRAALHHSSEPYPMCRITVNLAPSGFPKHGTALDLVVALGLLVAQERAPQRGLDGRLFLGELGLGGEVRPVRGALASAEAAKRAGLAGVVCARPNAGEASLAGLPVVGVGTLREALETVRGRGPAAITSDPDELLRDVPVTGLDLALVRDQERAKRTLEVAAAGGHNVLLSGPPGSGKTLLARALPGILPRLGLDEALEVTRIHSAAGLLPPGESLVRSRPFQAPHHGVSVAGMVGGGSSFIRPGACTIAHRGVLFLDELPEFPRSCLEALRQPLEDGRVTVTRSAHTAVYPARFMLVAAMNPCPCGHFGSETPCRCTPRERDLYRRRLSGPLLDRIDLHVHVPRVETPKLLDGQPGESSAEVRARVEAARALGAERGRRWKATCNAELQPGILLRACGLEDDARAVLSRASRRHRLSARSVHRLIRVARTIADLGGRPGVQVEDVFEAVTYRVADRTGGDSALAAAGPA